MATIPNPQRSDLVFVLRLCGGESAAPLQGCLEHVLSGRRHDFDTGAALLDCVAHEQRQLQRTDAATAPPFHPVPTTPQP